MAEIHETPFACHVFVCTNDRQGERKSCADEASPELRAALKQAVAKRGWRGRVRVSGCGCLGVCEQGPNVMLYPQGLWLSAASLDDAEQILAKISEIIEESGVQG